MTDGMKSSERNHRRSEAFMFWNFMAFPFVVAALSEFLVQFIYTFIPESLYGHSYFIFLILCFMVFCIIFHYCAFVLGPRVFGKPMIDKSIQYIDYVWYFFGGVFLSFFAVAEFQDDFFQETAEDRNFVADANETLLMGAFLNLRPACVALIERAESDVAFRNEYFGLLEFCEQRVADQDLADGFQDECEEALRSAQGLSMEELRAFRIVRAARGRDINDLEHLCNSAKAYESISDDYRQFAGRVEGWIGGGASQSFAIYVLLAALVALKFTKVTAGIRKTG